MPLAQRKSWKLTTIIENVTGDGGQVRFYPSKRDTLAHCEITFPPDGPSFWGTAPTPRAAANIAFRQLEARYIGPSRISVLNESDGITTEEVLRMQSEVDRVFGY